MGQKRVRVNTKPAESEEEVKDQTAAEEQPVNEPEPHDEKTSQVKTRKRIVFQSPVAVKEIVVDVKGTGEASDEAEEEHKPTFKEKVHKFVNTLGTVALIGGIGLAAYGDYQMKKAKEAEEENYPCEDDEDSCDGQYDPESEDDEEDDD